MKAVTYIHYRTNITEQTIYLLCKHRKEYAFVTIATDTDCRRDANNKNQ